MNNKQEFNQSAYSVSNVVGYYSRNTSLNPAEVRVVARCSQWICDSDILDIGVGAGRTTEYLSPLARTYRGIDYAQGMVDHCRYRFPNLDISQGDARKLQFANESFSFVMFSFNGIDYIHPDERQKALEEVFRVLKPGGRYAFSSHNLRALNNRLPGFKMRFPQMTRNPFTLANRWLTWIRSSTAGRRNYRRLQQAEFMNERLAWVNDGIHDYSMLTCYVSPETMVEQLRATGFAHDVELISLDGNPARPDARDPWIYAIATKPG